MLIAPTCFSVHYFAFFLPVDVCFRKQIIRQVRAVLLEHLFLFDNNFLEGAHLSKGYFDSVRNSELIFVWIY